MRIYKCLTYFTSVLATMSLLIAVILNFRYGIEYDFEENVCLAIFGSAALSAISSYVTYRYEKRNTLKSFWYSTVGLVKFLNKYQADFSLEKKLQFYLDYHDMDKYVWYANYEDIDFFFEKVTKNKQYIFNKIYLPIKEFNNTVSQYIWNFRYHIDGSGKNVEVMKKYIEELETYLIKKVEKDIPVEYDENNEPISFSKIKSFSPKLSKDITEEIYGRYLVIMCGEKAGKQFVEDKSNE